MGLKNLPQGREAMFFLKSEAARLDVLERKKFCGLVCRHGFTE